MNADWRGDLMYNSRVVFLCTVFPLIIGGRMLYDLRDKDFPSLEFAGSIFLAIAVLTIPAAYIYRYFVDVHAPRTGVRRVLVLFVVWCYWWLVPLAILGAAHYLDR